MAALSDWLLFAVTYHTEGKYSIIENDASQSAVSDCLTTEKSGKTVTTYLGQNQTSIPLDFH